jgi:hypothetical protein
LKKPRKKPNSKPVNLISAKTVVGPGAISGNIVSAESVFEKGLVEEKFPEFKNLAGDPN